MERRFRSLETLIREMNMNRNTELRKKVTNVGRPDTAEDPTDAKSKLAKQGEIKTKIIDEANFQPGDKVSYETSKHNKNNKGVVHSVKGDTVTVKGSNYLGSEVLHDVHHSMVRKEEAEIKEASAPADDKDDKDVAPKKKKSDSNTSPDSDTKEMDPKELKGGKTEVDLKPTTDERPEDTSAEDKKSKAATNKANKEIGAKGVKEETMTNKNFGLSASLIQTVNEVLKGNQHKLDKNHNGKIDAEDFKLLKGKKKMTEGKCSECGMDPCKCGPHVKEAKSCACEGKGPCQCSTNEEVEQIDELTGMKNSKMKQMSYAVKATKQVAGAQPTELANDKDKARKFKNRMTGLNTMKNKMAKEEVEQIDEISLKKKIHAYAATQHPDADYNYGDKVHDQGDRIKAAIVKKHGAEAGKHADAHARSDAYGRSEPGKTAHDHFKHQDKLTGFDKTRSGRVTKSGTMNKSDQKYNAGQIKKRLGTHKKPNLPEEVEFSAEEIARIEEIAKGL
jgi:hypothetical protein